MNLRFSGFDPNSTRATVLAGVLSQRLLRALVAFGAPLALWAVLWDIEQGLNSSAVVHAGAYAGLVIVVLIPRIHHLMRASVIVAMLLCLAFWGFIIFGPFGEGPIFLLTGLILVTLLLGKRAGYIGVAISVVIVILIALLRVETSIVMPQAAVETDELMNHWIATFFEIALFGSALNYVFATIFDHMIQALNTKEESERKYKLIADHADDVIWTLDHALDCIYASPSVEKLRGWPPHEVVGTSFSPDSDPEVVRDLAKVAEIIFSGKQLTRPLETNISHRDGHMVPTETIFSLITSDNGEPDVLLGVTRDLTIRQRMDRERESLEDQLRQSQKMDSLGQLAGGVAHDLNNLLQVILGYSELAQHKIDDSSPIYENLNQTRDAAERAAALVKQLLAFSRQQMLEITTSNLNTVVEDLIRMLQRLIGENVALEFVPDPELDLVRADVYQIGQVLINLCLNARDAMEGVGVLRISTENIFIDERTAVNLGTSCGNHVALRVSDNGVGIAPEAERRIFDPFYTTKKAGEGTGLGLSTAFGIVRQHNGTITVDSMLGNGSTFNVFLPTTDIPITTELTKRVSPMGGRETILVADDESLVLKVASETLRDAGYCVIEANDGVEALQIFLHEADKIDLVVLDVMMPRLGGKVVSQQVRALRPDKPILFCSGYNNDTVQIDLTAPSIPLLPKPYQREDLLSSVRELLDHANLVAELEDRYAPATVHR